MRRFKGMGGAATRGGSKAGGLVGGAATCRGSEVEVLSRAEAQRQGGTQTSSSSSSSSSGSEGAGFRTNKMFSCDAPLPFRHVAYLSRGGPTHGKAYGIDYGMPSAPETRGSRISPTVVE